METLKPSDMPDDIGISGWAAAWLDRTLPALHWETIAACYVLSIAALLINVRTAVAQFRVRKELKADPSNRAVAFATLDKRLHKNCKRILGISLLYLLHAMTIWIVDASISSVVLAKAATDGSIEWTPSLISVLIPMILLVFGSLVAAFILVPMAQLLLVTYILAKVYRKNGRNTLADYVPEARLLTTHMTLVWMMVCFFLVAFYPVGGDSGLLNSLAREAAFGSAFAWFDASVSFLFCADRLEQVELKGWPGVQEVVRLFGKQVVAVHSFSKKSAADTLPVYEAVPQSEDA